LGPSENSSPLLVPQAGYGPALNDSGVGGRGASAPPSFYLLKIQAKSLKIWAKSLKIQTKSLNISAKSMKIWEKMAPNVA